MIEDGEAARRIKDAEHRQESWIERRHVDGQDADKDMIKGDANDALVNEPNTENEAPHSRDSAMNNSLGEDDFHN